MKQFIVFGILTILFVNMSFSKTNSTLVSKKGIMFKDGKAIYYNPYLAKTGTIYLTKNYVLKRKEEIISGRLSFYTNNKLQIVSVDKKNHPIFKTSIDIYYTVTNNALYVSDNNKDWKPVIFKVVSGEHMVKQKGFS